MTLARTTAGINKAGEASTAHGQIRATDASQRAFPTSVAKQSPISWQDLPRDRVQPNVDSICLRQCDPEWYRFGNISE